jgi:hypothetical protein
MSVWGVYPRMNIENKEAVVELAWLASLSAFRLLRNSLNRNSDIVQV